MLAEKVKELIAGGESQTVEFKSVSAGVLGDSLFDTVSAFSNRHGGHILIGVADDGTISGVNPNACEGLRRNFANRVSNPEVVFPPLSLSLEGVEVDGKLVLSLYVPPHSHPVRFKSRTFDRAEDADVDITNNAPLMAALYQRKSALYTERKVFPFADLSQLRLAELMPTVRRRAVNKRPGHPWGTMEDWDILRSAGLWEHDPVSGVEGVNMAGVLLFGSERLILSCVPGYFIDCVLRRENLDRYDDRLMIRCNLLEAFDQITAFIAKHTLDRFFVVDGQRSGVRDHIAFEVVSNLLSHQEFASSIPARVTIERDRLTTENWNRPVRTGPIDPENFKPDPKNPLIAAFFVNAGLADTLGSGVRNLYRYTSVYSGQEPELIEGDVFTTIIPLGRSTPSDVPRDVTTDVPRNVTTDLGESEQRILVILRAHGSAPARELAAKTGLSDRQVKRVLTKLRETGIIEREGSTRYGKWVVLE
ncbi:MAG: putative DNA binding domain-containing protein [Propionibacteriaceae bacterium]|nr:putative DNA binding domain-containing protein [Propionibacteriaceae bacterium]